MTENTDSPMPDEGLARKLDAVLRPLGTGLCNYTPVHKLAALEAFAAILLAEREATKERCAKIADAEKDACRAMRNWHSGRVLAAYLSKSDTAAAIAAAIRGA